METRVRAPSDWPVIDDGLLMTYVDDVMLVRMDAKVSDAVFDRQLRELARAIDERPAGSKIGVVYDAMGGVDTSAVRRQRSGEVLAARRDKLAVTTAGFALASDSVVARGILRAVFWLAPPPYPWTVTSSVREALEYLRTQMPGLDVARVLREYDQLRARARKVA